MSTTDETAQQVLPGIAETVRFQRDLYLYWQCVGAAGGLALTSKLYVSRPALRRVRARLAAADGALAPIQDGPEVDDARLLFLRRLLERLGLLQMNEGRLVAARRDVMARFLAQPVGERLRLCVRVWVAGGWWPDHLDPRVAPPRPLVPALPRLALGRRRLVELLSERAPGDLVVVPPEATIPRVAASGRRPRATHAAHAAHSPAEAHDVQDAPIVRAALLGPLAWMGLVELDASDERYTSTPACAALRAVGRADDELRESPGRILVQPNFSIVAYPPLTAPALLQLHTCADEAAIERIARLTLTRTALARARAEGWTAADVAARLAALCGEPLPGNIRTTLDDWERHVERLRLTESAIVFDAHERTVLDKLLAERAASDWISRRLTDTAALVVPGQEAAVRGWLLRHGELPAVRRSSAG
jgi:hypothetical protein